MLTALEPKCEDGMVTKTALSSLVISSSPMGTSIGWVTSVIHCPSDGLRQLYISQFSRIHTDCQGTITTQRCPSDFPGSCLHLHSANASSALLPFLTEARLAAQTMSDGWVLITGTAFVGFNLLYALQKDAISTSNLAGQPWTG